MHNHQHFHRSSTSIPSPPIIEWCIGQEKMHLLGCFEGEEEGLIDEDKEESDWDESDHDDNSTGCADMLVIDQCPFLCSCIPTSQHTHILPMLLLTLRSTSLLLHFHVPSLQPLFIFTLDKTTDYFHNNQPIIW